MQLFKSVCVIIGIVSHREEYVHISSYVAEHVYVTKRNGQTRSK